MPVGKDSKQIPIVLPKKYIEKLEKLAEQEVRSVSGMVSKIIIDYFNSQEK